MRQLLVKIATVFQIIKCIVATEIWEDIRVHFDTFEIKRLFPDSQDIINDAGDQAAAFLKEFIKVKPSNIITFQENTGCGDLTAFPLSLRGNAYTDYDLMIMVRK